MDKFSQSVTDLPTGKVQEMLSHVKRRMSETFNITEVHFDFKFDFVEQRHMTNELKQQIILKS